jgi:hypothetical protein
VSVVAEEDLTHLAAAAAAAATMTMTTKLMKSGKLTNFIFSVFFLQVWEWDVRNPCHVLASFFNFYSFSFLDLQLLAHPEEEIAIF